MDLVSTSPHAPSGFFLGLWFYVRSGRLSSGRVALLEWNRRSEPFNVIARWNELGIANGTPITTIKRD
uniref:Uncharacterized protein n=1 Tax=Physcomitrium patens TaxID=3218 RepID=A0A7I4C4J0_PHYPA